MSIDRDVEHEGRAGSDDERSGDQDATVASHGQVDRSARRLAWEAVQRIDHSGAFANIVVPSMLGNSDLEDRDRRFVTQLVYGATRMRRACDHLIEPFLMREVDPDIRSLLRLGAYQLHFLHTPPHAAVGETVELAPRKTRGFVNAILRRVSEHTPVWPSELVRLSYPDWIGERLAGDWGIEDTTAMLERMNEPATVTERDDGYVQDTASQWVVDLLNAGPGMRILDVCAAPGGKATGLAATGATVVAADRKKSRVRLVTANADRLGADLLTVVSDATQPPIKPRSFDRVLVDAPCSGLGVLQRRADARWNLEPEAPGRLAELQRTMLTAAADLVAPGGILVYSVCTVTRTETIEVAETPLPGFEPLPISADDDAEGRWRPLGTGGVVLPHDHGTDGMAAFRWQFPLDG